MTYLPTTFTPKNKEEVVVASDVMQPIRPIHLLESNSLYSKTDQPSTEIHFTNKVPANVYSYNESVIFEVFQHELNRFLAYVSARTLNVETLEQQTLTLWFGAYLSMLYTLIANVLHVSSYHENENALAFAQNFLYDEARKMFGLEHLPYIQLTNKDYFLSSWGPTFWRFLHALSILCSDNHVLDENQQITKVSKRKSLNEQFAACMIDFHLLLLCGVCSDNYKRNAPLMNVTLPIYYGQDAITVIHTLHNEIRKDNGQELYDFNTFLQDWNVELLQKRELEISATFKL